MLKFFSRREFLLFHIIKIVVFSQTLDVVRLSNNYRDLQDQRSDERTMYKSMDAGGCDDITYGPTATRTASFPHLSSTKSHWVYMDQDHWTTYAVSPNECEVEGTPVESYPGESPIDIEANQATTTDEATISLSGFSLQRDNLEILNNGHGVEIPICSGSYLDCSATASFGTWPKVLRGISDDSISDTYYLESINFHWGSDNSKGSEHAVCGLSAAGEVQMFFTNTASVTDDRTDPYSATKYVVLSTMLEGGADDNMNYSSIFDHIPTNEGDVDEVDIQLDSLLAFDYDTKYFTYAGSLTIPPCWQQVTWFVSQTSVKVSDAQLDNIRDATMLNHQHDNSYEALIFPFVGMVMGTATEHMLNRYAPQVPYTVAILGEGLIVDWLASFNRKSTTTSSKTSHVTTETVTTYIWPDSDTTMQRSIDMWANIDGHLLLYAFLPALLFGESMTLNVHMFKQTFFQCLILACPGVLFGTFVTGFCAMYLFPYEWSFYYSMVFGSILAATDPVAVVALLKSVGASPKLTLQITGESLMNDGTAIVLFSLFMRFLNDYDMDAGGVISFFLQMMVAGPLIGIGLGLAAVLWIREAKRKFSQSDITVQTSITICCAYIAFFLSESESSSSGVLCTVATGLVLAKYGWPVVISHETLENVWHAIEYFGNTLIFFLAGVITRRAMISPNILAVDYLYCIVMYIIIMVIRGIMVLMFYPLLKRLGYGTNPKDAFFIVWGGLRGAVGLALAIYVRENRDDQKAGDQLVFHVCGIAFLTLCINGTTSRLVLRKLDLVGLPELKKKMIDEVRQRVIEKAEKDYVATCTYLKHDASDALSLISNLRHLLLKDGNPNTPSKEKNVLKHCEFGVLQNYHKPKIYDEKEIESFLKTVDPADPDRLQLMRETYYRIVRAGYWEMIEDGHLPPAGMATLELLKSVDVCLDDTSRKLWDWELLKKKGECKKDFTHDDFLKWLDGILPATWTWDNELHYLLNFRYQEASYYICHAFVYTHLEAQEKLAVFYGEDKTVDSAEEAEVILESLKMVKLAEEALERMNETLVKHIKSMFVADKMINIQQSYVTKLIHQGVLAEAEAEELLLQLKEDAIHIQAARKSRANDYSRRQVSGMLAIVDSSLREHPGDLDSDNANVQFNSESGETYSSRS